MRVKLFIFAVVSCALSILSSRGTCDDQALEAKAEFKRGVELYNQGSFQEAVRAFRRANDLNPSWSLLFNIAQSEAAAKRYGLAYEAFEEYLAKGGDDLTEERKEMVIGELNNMKNLIGSLEISAPTGATVTVDGMLRGAAPLPGRLKVAIGVVHEVEVKLDGALIHSENVKVSQGETVRIDAASAEDGTSAEAAQRQPVEPKPAETSIEAPPDEKGSSSLKPIGWTGVGVGASLLVAAAATGGVALSIKKDLDEKCEDGVCPQSEKDRKETKDALGISTDVLLGVGVAVTAVGIGLLIYSARSKKKEQAKDISIMPFVGGSGAAVAVSGRF